VLTSQSINVVTIRHSRSVTQFHILGPSGKIYVHFILKSVQMLPGSDESIWIKKEGGEYRQKPYKLISLLCFEHHNNCTIYVGRDRPASAQQATPLSLSTQNPIPNPSPTHAIPPACPAIDNSQRAKKKRKPRYVNKRIAFKNRVRARQISRWHKNNKTTKDEPAD